MSQEVLKNSFDQKKELLKRMRPEDYKKKNAECHRIRRSKETDEERNARLYKMRLSVAEKRKVETDEQRNIRRDNDRLRKATKRQKETVAELLDRECANDFCHIKKRSKKYLNTLQNASNEEDRRKIVSRERTRIFLMGCQRIEKRKQKKKCQKVSKEDQEWDRVMEMNRRDERGCLIR
jgi:hypothetical protein